MGGRARYCKYQKRLWKKNFYAKKGFLNNSVVNVYNEGSVPINRFSVTVKSFTQFNWNIFYSAAFFSSSNTFLITRNSLEKNPPLQPQSIKTFSIIHSLINPKILGQNNESVAINC